jgi:hypothetical protein
MILIAYRHGLRASEVCDLQWHQVELVAARLHVRRSKRGTSSVHPIQGDELRALRRRQREQPSGPHVFVSERGAPMAPKSFHALIQLLGERAGMPFAIHPHMLRHSCGYELANTGHDSGRCRRGSGTGISRTRCAILSWRLTGLKISGEIEIAKALGIGRASVYRMLASCRVDTRISPNRRTVASPDSL